MEKLFNQKTFLKYSLIVFIFILTSCSIFRKKYVEPTTNRVVQVQTEYGNINITLSDSTPLHRDNFIKLVKEKFYDSLLFHRVINEFMIQGGDPQSKNAVAGTMLGNGGLTYTIPAEFNLNLFHKRGALAAARDNNPAKASSSTQFYIVQGKKWNDAELTNMENTRLGGRKLADSVKNYYKEIGGTVQLDMNYTVFGYATNGFNVIDSIATLPKDNNNRPLKDTRMKIVIIH
jgi:cyclophilin family peptidyl-prolyl cis-trans isomerase